MFLGITLLFPIMLFVITEGFLRLIGYGPLLNLFNQETHNGTDYHVINQQVASRYFSRINFNPNTSPDYFLVNKPDTTYRIFCLGGSTTAGFPYQFGGAFATFLRDRLSAKFPERHIEVVNLGMTATNSFTVLDIAEDLFAYKPDLLIVYDGHNEFYGALGIASNETLGSIRWLTRLYLKLVHFRTFLLLRDSYNAVASLFGKPINPGSDGTMMERMAKGQYIRYGSTSYLAALEIYKQNLHDLKELCKKYNVPVMVGSQVSNLRDQPPFISEPAEHLTSEQSDAFIASFSAGIEAQRIGNHLTAARHFASALVHDSLRADAHYLLAQCYDTLGQKSEALRAYIKARDFDMLRFRASSDFNRAMRETADDTTVFFVDIERKFKANSHDSLIGRTLITEHLHPNVKGNFLIAKEFQWMMHWHKILATQDEWNDRANTSDERLWDDRAVTDLDERAARKRLQILTSGWPFTDADRRIPAAALDDTLGRIVDNWVRGDYSWEHAHVQAAQFYEHRGEVESEIREYRTIMRLLPLNVSPYLFLAKAYLKQGRNQEAASVLLRSLRVEKTWFAYKTLGILALDPPVAIDFFRNSVDASMNDEQKVEALYLLAVAFARNNDQADAVEHLHHALELNPHYVPAREFLSILSPQVP